MLSLLTLASLLVAILPFSVSKHKRHEEKTAYKQTILITYTGPTWGRRKVH